MYLRQDTSPHFCMRCHLAQGSCQHCQKHFWRHIHMQSGEHWLQHYCVRGAYFPSAFSSLGYVTPAILGISSIPVMMTCLSGCSARGWNSQGPLLLGCRVHVHTGALGSPLGLRAARTVSGQAEIWLDPVSAPCPACILGLLACRALPWLCCDMRTPTAA